MASSEFSDAELRELHRVLQSAALEAYPNPERKGCPGPAVLDEMAGMSVPSQHPFYEHVATCSPCLKEMLDLRGQKIRARKTLARKRLGLAVGFAAVAAIVGLAFVLLQYTQRQSVQQPSTQMATNGKGNQNDQRWTAVLNFQNLTAQRGSGESGSSPQVVSHTARKLVIELPVGSETAVYTVEIRKASDLSPIKEYQAKASKTTDGIVELQFQVDLSGLPNGSYVAAWRHMGTLAWDLGPFVIK